MGLHRVSIALAVLAAWTGCTDDEGAQTRATNIKLLAAGLEPHQAMRYRFQKGRSRTLRTTIRTAGTNHDASSGIEATVVVHQKDIRTIGDLHHHFEIASVRPVGEPGGDLVPVATALAGTRGRAVVSSSGHRRSIHFQHESAPPGGISPLAGILRQQLLQLPVPFPEDAVGVGAEWKAGMPAAALSDTARQQGRYKLVYRDQHESRLEVRLELTDKKKIVAKATGTMWVTDKDPLPRVELELALQRPEKTLSITTERHPEPPD